MDQQTAEKVLADVVARWNESQEQDDELAVELAVELEERLDLTHGKIYVDPIRHLTKRLLEPRERDILFRLSDAARSKKNIDQYRLKKALADIVVRWDKSQEQDDELAMKLAVELEKRLDLTNRESYVDQIEKRVKRPLKTRECDILIHLYDVVKSINQQRAEKVLVDIIAQWEQDNILPSELASELEKRLNLTNRESYVDRVEQLVNRRLKTKECDILSHLWTVSQEEIGQIDDEYSAFS